MKAHIKNNRNLICLLLFVFIIPIIESCSVVTKTTVIGTKDIPKSKKVTNTILTYDGLQLPTVSNPNIKLSINSVDEYSIETKKHVRIERKPSDLTKGFMWGFPIAMAVGVNLIPGVTEDVGARILASLGVIALSIPFSLMAKALSSGTRKLWQDGELKYRRDISVPIKDNLIAISYSDKFIEHQTNKYGVMSFSPLNDFGIDFSMDNLPKQFYLSYQKIKFNDVLQLKPSLWLNHFAKINSSTAKIWENKSFNSPSLGSVRKGLEYKVLEEDNQFNRYKVVLFSNKFGWLDFRDVKSYYSTNAKTDNSLAIKNYVEEKMTEWQKQGEFESPSDYFKRMEAREGKLKEITYEAMGLFQNDYMNMISWNAAQISRYDPNSQTFKIDIPEINEFVLQVPIEIAQLVKENWSMKKFKNQKFILVDGKWELTYLEIKVPEVNKTIKYNSALISSYNPVNQFSFELKPLKIDLSTNNSELDDLAAIKYDISINLPKTNMSNPEAVAVVIGNTNYKYMSDVDYAINDAQLVKTYLINIIGYKPGNVLFYPNASKADFEGLFGTKDRYEGKLNNFLKAGISDVLIFYSGHGAPGLNDQKGYFVPVDCDPLYVELQGYNSDILYNNLAKVTAKSVTVIIDACFSGADIIDNISSIIPAVHQPIFKIENGSLLSSSSSDEVSCWLNQQQHGLFTYFFLKAIHDYKNSDINNDSKLTLNEIYNYVSDNSNGVPYFARRLNAKKQHPTILGNKEKILIEF